MFLTPHNTNTTSHCLLIVLFVLLSALLSRQGPQVTQQQCDSMIREAVTLRENRDDLELSLKILQDVESIAKFKKWHKQEFLALNNIGVVYMANHSYGEALDYFDRAYTVAEEHLKSDETKTALNNIAIVYTKEKNVSKAAEIFKKAYDIAAASKDSVYMGLYALNLGQASITLGKLAEARRYLDVADRCTGDNTYLQRQLTGVRADLAFSRHDYKQAQRLCREIIGFPDITTPKYSEILHQAYFIMAQSSFRLGDSNTAMRYATLAVGSNATMEQKIEGYQFLSELEYTSGNYPRAFACKDSVIALSDSLYSTQNNRLMKVSKAKFELQAYRHELTMKESQLRSMRIIMTVSVLALVILVALAWWGIRNHIQKLRQRHESEENKRVIAEQALREKETESQLEHERLKGQIESRNRELAAKVLYFSSRSKMVEEMVSLFDDKAQLTRAQRAKLDELRNGLDSGKEWNEFAELFEQTNNGLLLKLKQRHGELNPADLRFIIYTYMNLSNKEIASMLSITLDACRKRKERVSKKLGLESSNELHNYLFSL